LEARPYPGAVLARERSDGKPAEIRLYNCAAAKSARSGLKTLARRGRTM
jgi:hypothetical protein